MHCAEESRVLTVEEEIATLKGAATMQLSFSSLCLGYVRYRFSSLFTYWLWWPRSVIPRIRRKIQKDDKFKIYWLCSPGWLLLVCFALLLFGLIFYNFLGGCFRGEGPIWEYQW